jgi:hypothetical protein
MVLSLACMHLFSLIAQVSLFTNLEVVADKIWPPPTI